MKMHLNLATRDLDANVAFYATLLGAKPAKQLDDYALFITECPGLELALDLDANAKAGPGQHFGIVVETTEDVGAQISRLEGAGYATDLEREETYVVLADTEERDDEETSCCRTDAAVESGATCCA